MRYVEPILPHGRWWHVDINDNAFHIDGYYVPRGYHLSNLRTKVGNVMMFVTRRWRNKCKIICVSIRCKLFYFRRFPAHYF